MTRILAINPNTSPEVTAAFVAEARRIAPGGVVVEGVTGGFGARIVTREAENVIAAHAALQLAADHANGVGAVILAISFDSGLRALRDLLPVPVVGVTESALVQAGDAPLGVVSFGASSTPLYTQLLADYGHKPVAWDVVEFKTREDYLNAPSKDAMVLEAITRLAASGAETAVLLGTVVAGMAARLQPYAAIPVSDGAAAVSYCLTRIATHKKPAQPSAPTAGTIGLSATLTALIAGTTE